MYAAAIGSWVTQFMTMFIFLGLGLESTWAAHYLARSGRRFAARIGCYVELYLPVIVLFIELLGILEIFIAMVVMHQNFVGPPWGVWLSIVAATAVWAVAAAVGVMRRWHPLIRVGLYAAWIGLTVGMLVRASGRV